MSEPSCASCDHEDCPAPRIKQKRPEIGCMAWTSLAIREYIKTLPVITIAKSKK